MKDTSGKIKDMYDKMFLNMPLEERAKKGFQMYETSRKIILSTIKNNQNWRTDFFLIFYGNDFDEKTKAKILKAI